MFWKRKKRKRKKKLNASKLFETFTKLWVSVLLVVALIDLQLSYILSFIGRSEIAETLSVAIVTEIVGVIAVYMIKSFLETSSEKKHNLEMKKLELPDEEHEEDSESVTDDEEINIDSEG